MYKSTKEHAAEIRAELKKHGWNARDISVRAELYSMGSTIHVTIKSAAIPLSTVKTIAEAHERIDRCAITGDILSGGNRYVRVRYDGALPPVRTPTNGEVAIEMARLASEVELCSDPHAGELASELRRLHDLLNERPRETDGAAIFAPLQAEVTALLDHENALASANVSRIG